MANIIINNRKNAIEITKEFQKKASIFESNEYNELKRAKADCPTYRVCVKSAPKRKIEDRMTINDMMLYIEKHSGQNSLQMKTFKELRGVSVKDAGNRGDAIESAKFHEIKEWFFATYSELAEKTANRQKQIDAIISNAKAVEAADEAASA
jgi:hypothetical protein